MADETSAELNQLFDAGHEELEPAVVSELKSIMRTYDLPAQEVFYKWESYCINRDLDHQRVSIDALRPFKQSLLDALERASRAKSHLKSEKRMVATPRTVAKSGDVFNMLDGMTTTPGVGRMNKPGPTRRRPLETPSVSRVKANNLSSSPDYKTPTRLENQMSSLGAIPPSSFNDRANAGDVIEVLNDHLPAGEAPIAPPGESRIKLTAASDQKKLSYKPLAMKLLEASEILDDRIDDFTNLIAEHYKLDDSSFGNPAGHHTETIVAVGRIASDTAEGKLNAASVVLETSRRIGNGLRVPLTLDKLKGYQFFPGQIVAFHGSNASGSSFVVTEELKMPLLPNAASTPAALSAHRQNLRRGPDAMNTDSEDFDPMPLNIIFASGPYTADDNLDFEPLHALCSRAADSYADALVLTGPFIDMEHPLVAAGEIDLPEEALAEPDTLTMASVFKWLVSPALNRFVAANPHATVLLVPSVRDVLAKHVSWPQDAFSRRELGLHKSVKIIGNPMTVSINEAVVGMSSQDVLWELRHEELVGGRAGPPDPVLLARVARYLVEQRHYFPLFPPTDRRKLPKTGTETGLPPGSMLDLSYLKLGEMVNVRPDVLITPSALQPFAKVVESVLVINPGFLSKRRGAGTYAKVSLHAPKLTDDERSSGAMLSHRVFERARVEITRI